MPKGENGERISVFRWVERKIKSIGALLAAVAAILAFVSVYVCPYFLKPKGIEFQNPEACKVLVLPFNTYYTNVIGDPSIQKMIYRRFEVLKNERSSVNVELLLDTMISTDKINITKDVALARGLSLGADLVIWGEKLNKSGDSLMLNWRFTFPQDSPFTSSSGVYGNKVLVDFAKDMLSGKITSDLENLVLYVAALEKFQNGQYRDAIQLFEKIQVGTYKDQLYANYYLAKCYEGLNSLDSCEVYLRKVLCDFDTSRCDEDTEKAIEVIDNLGLVYIRKRESFKVLQYYIPLFVYIKKCLGENHRANAGPLANYGTYLCEYRMYDEGLNLLKKSLDILQRSYPDGHPLIGNVYRKIGDLYEEKVVLDSARKYYCLSLRNDFDTRPKHSVEAAIDYCKLAINSSHYFKHDVAQQFLDKAWRILAINKFEDKNALSFYYLAESTNAKLKLDFVQAGKSLGEKLSVDKELYGANSVEVDEDMMLIAILIRLGKATGYMSDSIQEDIEIMETLAYTSIVQHGIMHKSNALIFQILGDTYSDKEAYVDAFVYYRWCTHIYYSLGEPYSLDLKSAHKRCNQVALKAGKHVVNESLTYQSETLKLFRDSAEAYVSTVEPFFFVPNRLVD